MIPTVSATNPLEIFKAKYQSATGQSLKPPETDGEIIALGLAVFYVDRMSGNMTPRRWGYVISAYHHSLRGTLNPARILISNTYNNWQDIPEFVRPTNYEDPNAAIGVKMYLAGVMIMTAPVWIYYGLTYVAAPVVEAGKATITWIVKSAIPRAAAWATGTALPWLNEYVGRPVCRFFSNVANAVTGPFQSACSQANPGAWWRVFNVGSYYSGTAVPRTFSMEVLGKIFNFHPNATKHMYEYVVRNGGGQQGWYSMTQVAHALKTAMEQGLQPGRNFITIGNVEIGIDTIGNVVYHFLTK